MKWLLYILFALTLTLGGCSNHDGHPDHEGHKQQEEQKTYTCPMHPQILKDAPGQCPICGMDLVEKKQEGKGIRDTAISLLLKPVNQYVLSNIKTTVVSAKELPLEFTATGTITYDPEMIYTVSSRVAGRIEKLYVKYRFQPIKKGERLMDINSKDLLTEQENYLYLLMNDSDNQTLLNAAENKLLLSGLNKEQILELKKTKKVIPSVTIYSPYAGHLHDSEPVNKAVGMDAGKMEKPELAFHKGMYVEKGQTVFTIYSTDKVWALLDVHPENQRHLKKGQQIKLFIDGVKDTTIARINFIEPALRPGQKTITVRVYLSNADGAIKIGAFVKAIVSEEKRKGLYIPETAVIGLGLNDVVFVLRENLFEAIPVKIGARTDGWVEVISGLEKADHLAENAQLLMDSESFIKIKH